MIMNELIFFLNQNGVAIQAITTFVLVVITLYYAFQARATVKEMSRQRKESFRPIIVAEKFTINGSNKNNDFCIECELKNIGMGPALEIEVNFIDKKTEELVASSLHYIDYIEVGSNSLSHIHIPKAEFKNLRYTEDSDGGMSSNLISVIYFNNIYNETYVAKQGFAVKKDTNSMKHVLGTYEVVFLGKYSVRQKISHFLLHRK